MAILPLRNLGTGGVVTDVDPYDLPAEAFSFAKNVRFENAKIQRGPVFRKVADLTTEPDHLISFLTQTNDPQTLYVDKGGSVRQYSVLSGVVDLSPTFAPTTGSFTVNSCVLNNVLYVNRSDRVPWYRAKDASGTDFAPIPTGATQWPENARARVLRAMSGVLVAGNIQKGANTYPNMVKWSNFSIEAGQPPQDWDYTSPSSNAGENTLAEMDGVIQDMVPLRNTMFIYTNKETWTMEFIGGLDMFRFQRAFDRGVLSDSCAIEEGGVQYVFGQNDIWLHDGSQFKSLASGKVRRFVYDTMVRTENDKAFVVSNPKLNEIIFCYVSDDKYVKFPAVAGKGCNRAVIYNYNSDSFTFADMPYVTSATQTYLDRGDTVTFNSSVGSYDESGGSYTQLESSLRTNLTFACGPLTTSSALRTFEDYQDVESGFLLDPEANAPTYLERGGYDLDEIKAELRGYKLISSIYPQGRLGDSSQELLFTFGMNDHPSGLVEWGAPQTYTPEYYKLDFNIAGRFLSLKCELNDLKPFTLSGLDLDVTILGSY